jgi:hypothetical protein
MGGNHRRMVRLRGIITLGCTMCMLVHVVPGDAWARSGHRTASQGIKVVHSPHEIARGVVAVAIDTVV